ncbi:MAG: hypothetical protein ACO4BJ_07275 [Planctomycetota bacterium]
MAELLNRYARLHEIVPVESWMKDGIDGWLFRDRNNSLIFIAASELQGHQPHELAEV